MKKVMQIVLVMMVLVCIYCYTKSETTISLAQEPDKEDYAIETDREIENETENEPLEQIRSTVIGEVEILEKPIQANIEVEGWNRDRTWDLKYPYFCGDEAALLRKINDQIYEWVRERNMDDSDELYYIELTYEITYMDERIVSILFEGDGSGSSYYGNSHGMSFDLKTGELLSLTDFYIWSEWKNLMENAMEQDQLRTQILRGYTELEEDENREYLEEYFIPLFQEDSDLEQVNLDFFIKDGYLHFITHAYPSCREDSYVKWEVPFWDGSNSKNSSIYESNKLDIWMGRYGFTDTFEHNSGEINYFVDYEIIIYKDDGKYYAELEGNGWFLQTRSLAYVEGDENSIDIFFKSSLPGDSLYGIVERYEKDELMLTLSYDDSELISSWHVLRKEHPIFIESEEEIKGVYFEKLDDMKNRSGGSFF